MFGRKKNKDQHRFYLLPGMGSSNRRHHRLLFRWSIVVGIVVSILFATLLYYANRY